MTFGTGTTPPHGGYSQQQQGYGYQQQQGYGYRQQYPTPLAQPQWGVPATIMHTAPAQYQAPLPPSLTKQGRSIPWWLWIVAGVLLLAVLTYYTAVYGLGGVPDSVVLACFFISLIPLAIVVVAAHLIDRWEPEPLRFRIFALLWGGSAAIVLTLLVVLLTDPGINQRTDEGIFFVTVVRAPVVEEFFKGVGLLLIFWVGKRALDGPVDGIVYGALVGAGFAFTENIQYFVVQYVNYGAESVGTLFLLRGIMSPFCHAMFTVCTGFAIGLAARHGKQSRVLGYFLVGLIVAILLHALWNGSALLAGDNFFTLYAVVQVPLFITFIVIVLWLRREEQRLTYRRLGEYATAGWFTPQEVNMLATPRGRRQAKAWARSRGGNVPKIMASFITDSNALAAARQRAVSGRDPHASMDEHVLLQRTLASRNALISR